MFEGNRQSVLAQVSAHGETAASVFRVIEKAGVLNC
jgi:hypothetical protein